MTASKRTVILVGLHPDAVDYAKWPGLTPERLMGSMAADQARFAEIGIDGEVCFVDPAKDAPGTMRAALGRTAFDFVLIGAGVRTNPDHLLLFEELLNLAHQHAPQAKLCFNTGPTDSVAAVRRWLV